ncbi:hypothetical protein T08_12490, partial [Trichinella sp. T8]
LTKRSAEETKPIPAICTRKLPPLFQDLIDKAAVLEVDL